MAMTHRLRNLGIATALATLAAVLITLYITNYKKSVRSDEKGVPVLVAARDIPAGTPGSQIVAEHALVSAVVPRRSVAPGAVSSPTEIAQLVVTEPLLAGDQVNARRFGSLQQQGLQAGLKGNLRALQVPGDGDQLLAGTLKDGDHVDVVASVKFTPSSTQAAGSGTERVASRIVLRDIRVLRAPVGSGGGPKVGSTGTTTSALLAVTDSQAQKLFFVMRNGEWSLALRPSFEAADSPDSVETAQSVLGDGLSSSQRNTLVSAGGTR